MRTVIALVLSLSSGLAAASPTDPAAIVYGRAVTMEDVDRPMAAKIHALEQQIFALRRSSLENLIARMVLEETARERGMSFEELKTELSGPPPAIGAAEIEATYIENAASFAGMSGDEARERIRLDLQTAARMRTYRDAVQKLVDAAPVERRLDEPRIAAERRPGGAVVLTVFSDFECPFCRAMVPALRAVRARYGERVEIAFRHFPLDSHPRAFDAARGAVCASRQGRFWEFHDALFAASEVTAATIRQAASKAGAELPAWSECIASETSALAVLADREAGRQLGVDATPTLVLNGRVLRGATDLPALEEAIQRELQLTQPGAHAPGRKEKE